MKQIHLSLRKRLGIMVYPWDSGVLKTQPVENNSSYPGHLYLEGCQQQDQNVQAMKN